MMSTSPAGKMKYGPPIDVPCITLDDDVSPPKREELGTQLQDNCISPFQVTGLLSPLECDRLIKLAETPSKTYLQKVDWEYAPSYRDCSRAVLRCPKLASSLYSRILPLLSEKECEAVRPFGFDGGEEWRPQKLNEVIRISRYDQGGHFSPHKDGAFVENDNVRSVYTVLVYLNDPPAFVGGDTLLHLPVNSEEQQEEAKSNIVRVVPRTGSAVVMLHDTLHEGEVVVSGKKYVCRFDIMFQRLGGGMTRAELNLIPSRIEAERLYSSSIAKQCEGDVEGSTHDYLQALQLQAQLPSCSSASLRLMNVGHDESSLSHLSDELIVMCFRFLDPTKLGIVSLVSKRFRILCSNSLMWREFFLIRWPTLVSAESTVKSTGDRADMAIPLAIHDQCAHRRGSCRRERTFSKVYVTFLSSVPETYQGSSEKMNRIYSYGGGSHGDSAGYPPPGYMYSCLGLADFDLKKRKQYRNWVCVDAIISEGEIQFAETKDRTLAKILPSSIPLLAETKLLFASSDYKEESDCWIRLDACILKVPGSRAPYLAMCTEDPWADGSRFGYGFVGILDDISRVVVARQTERALRYQDKIAVESVAVRCDAKVKQWKTAYSRRHLAERFFDVVTVDIGSKWSKFTSSTSSLDSLLSDYRAWSNWWYQGPHHSSLDATVSFFLEAARSHRPKYLLGDYFSPILVDPDDTKKQNLLRHLVIEGKAKELFDLAKDDLDLESMPPQPLVEAERSCGTIKSLVSNAAGHLWSAGHGLQNSLVGQQCLENNWAGPVRGSFKGTLGRVPETDVMGIIIAYIVEDCFVRRPKHSTYYHRTCAEHPINIVEPVLGFSEGERMALIQTLSTYNVPFVGFVNGAVAALMCGAEPKRNGVVVMLGGTNSAVGFVKDGSFVEGLALNCCNKSDDDEYDELEAAEEVSRAVGEVLNSCGGDGDKVNVLLTGGRATDNVVGLVRKRMMAQNVRITVASNEQLRHLDAVRGAHILASLSDCTKHFRGIMNLMWSVKVPPS